MDSTFCEKSSAASFRKGQKRRRSPERELPQLPESGSGTCGSSKNRQKRNGTNAEKDSAPQSRRGESWGVRQSGQFCEASTRRKLRSTVSASKNAPSTAVQKNGSNTNVTRGVQHESTCTDKNSSRKRKRLPSHERNSALDLPTTSSRVRNDLSSNVSEGPAVMTTERASSSRSSDREDSQVRPGIRRRDARNEVRASSTIRSRLHDRSNHSFSFEYSFDIEPAAEQVTLSPSLISIICTFGEGMVFSSLQDIRRLIADSLNLDAGLESHGLSTARINRLPTRCYSETATSGHEETFHANECQICLCAYKERVMLRTLPCLHEFHSSCIDKWLKINRSCPVCRALIDSDPDDQ